MEKHLKGIEQFLLNYTNAIQTLLKERKDLELNKNKEYEMFKKDQFIESIPFDKTATLTFLEKISIARNTIYKHKFDSSWYDSQNDTYNLRLYVEWVKFKYPLKYPKLKEKYIKFINGETSTPPSHL